MQLTDAERDGVVTVVLTPAVAEAFAAYLNSRGLELSAPIPDGAGDMFRIVGPARP